MANRWKGNMIAVSTSSSGTDFTGRADGVWSLDKQLQQKQSSLWAKALAKAGAPTIGTASYTSGGNASVSFSAPSSDGGSPITGYKIYANGSFKTTVASSPASITGLSDGTLYQFTVVAVNDSGDGPFSNLSNQVGITVPSPPSYVTLGPVENYNHPVWGNMLAMKISFGPSPNNGGSPLTGYRLRLPALGINTNLNDAYTNMLFATNNLNYPGYATSAFTGNTYYQATVTAVNAIGESNATYSNNFLTPVTIGSSYQGGYYAGTVVDAGTTYKIIASPLSGGMNSTAAAIMVDNGTYRPDWGTLSLTAGPSNSSYLANNQNSSAAQFCENSNLNGYSDWYLPCKADKDLLEVVSPWPSGEGLLGPTWTSTQTGNNTDMYILNQYGSGRFWNSYKARMVRRTT
jgi:hypothetical protein